MARQLGRDLKTSLRALARAPGFTAVAILTLGLGIGANTSLFSVVHSVLLKPLPYQDPGRLVLLWHQLTNVSEAAFSGPDYVDYRDRTDDVFSDLIGMFATSTNLTGDGDAEAVVLSWVSPSFFGTLGVNPSLGRDFTGDDVQSFDIRRFSDPDVPPPALPVILSSGLWQQRYGSDPGIVGQTIHANGQIMTVVGVAPAGFRLHLPPDAGMPTDVDIWTVWPVDLGQMPRAPSGIITVLGRLNPGVTLEQAQDRVDRVAADIRAEHQSHELASLRTTVMPLHQEAVGHLRPALFMLLGAVGFVLLIACANVANLMLVRASAREKEVAIRTALGGSRAAVVRPLMVESTILAAAGAALGLVLALFGIDLLVSLQPADFPRLDTIAIDRPVLLFTLGATAVAALVFGLVPAFASTPGDLTSSLKDRSTTASRSRHRLRQGLIVLEVATSMVLLVGAGLMLRSMAGLTRVHPGFDTDNVLSFHFALPVWAYRSQENRSRFFRELDDRIAELPGVVAVGGVNPLPLSSSGQFGSGSYARPGDGGRALEENEADYRSIVPGFFEAAGTPLLAGRTFEPRDNEPGGRPVAIIDRLMAEKVFPGEDPVGQQLIVGQTDSTLTGSKSAQVEIVGVVEHIRYSDLASDGRETLYLPQSFSGGYAMGFAVKTAGDPMQLAPRVRELVRQIGPDVPIMDVAPLESYLNGALGPTRFALTMLGVFALVALLLAAVGLYGVIGYTVRQRRREMGLRLALGAEPAGVMKLVVGYGVKLTALGLVVGALGGVLLSRGLETLVFGVSATDPATYLAIALVLLATAALASLVPARRAAAVDPNEALRAD